MVLFPVFELVYLNHRFPLILLDAPSVVRDDGKSSTPPVLTLLTLSSYLLTHASSTSSARAIAYAHLALNVLLAFAENHDVMAYLSQPQPYNIRLCRQVRLGWCI